MAPALEDQHLHVFYDTAIEIGLPVTRTVLEFHAHCCGSLIEIFQHKELHLHMLLFFGDLPTLHILLLFDALYTLYH